MDVLSYLQSLSYWDWFIFAGLLLLVEVLGTAGYFLLFASAAAIVGIVAWVFPNLHWALQYVLFSGLSLVCSYAWWLRLKRCPVRNESLNKRGSELLGHEFVLHEAITLGRGKVRVGDGFWIVAGKDLPQGARVKVVGLDGVVLNVIEI